jgi:PAS domain-containing protein
LSVLVETLVARRFSDSSDLSALSGVAPALATAFASLTGDIALVIDPAGVIRDVALAGACGGHPAGEWVGRVWAETVTGDTRRKIELLLQETSDPGVTRRREVNHPSHGGADIPMSYAAVRLGLDGPVIAVGRDLRAVAAIQQRFVEAQREMERGYWKLRQEASRQRMLAQVATDALMLVDGATRVVQELNAAGEAMFGARDARGAPLPPPAEELLVKALHTGRPQEIRTRLSTVPGSPQVDLCAMPLRLPSGDGGTPGAMQVLLRARSAAVDGTSLAGEAVVVTDSSGSVLVANAAFRALCRADAGPVEGRALGELLGDPQRHLAAALVDARRGGLVRRPALLLGGGRTPTFECAAQVALMNDGDQECIGITLVPAQPSRRDSLRAALLALLDRTGELPLAELMRRACDLTERHAVETVLRRTAGGSQGDAASVLGLSEADLAERL